MRGAMTRRLTGLLETLWFLPGLIVGAFAGAAIGVGTLEGHVDTTGIPLVFPGDAEAARGILSSIASSVITVAGLTLSITMVVLQLVATQYTPRALRQVLRDRLTQVASGVFVGVFVFALVVLRSVRQDRVPALGVTLSIVLSVCALGLLLGFVNNVAQSIQVETITADTSRQAIQLVRERYPSEPHDAPEGEMPGSAREVIGRRTGFLQLFGDDTFVRKAPSGIIVVELLLQPGDFTTAGEAVARVESDAADALDDAIRASMNVADHRTLSQDVNFAVRLLADIALRALSPGVNDPTTAINAVRHAGAVVEEIARRSDLPRSRRLRGGEILIVERPRPFSELLSPLEEVGRAAHDVRPLGAVLDALERIAVVAEASGQRGHAAAAAEASVRSLAAARRQSSDPALDDLERKTTGARLHASG